MRIHSFVFNWNGHADNCLRLESALDSISDRVTVINSAEDVTKPWWRNLGDSAWFTRQWCEALSCFDGDVLFHIQADVFSEELCLLFQRFRTACSAFPLGVYAPNVDYTYWSFQKDKLKHISGNLYLTPQTDCTCWFITREILDAFPGIDSTANAYGWGIDWVVIALARLKNKLVLRDFAITVSHPHGTGYNDKATAWEFKMYLRVLPANVRQQVIRLSRESHAALDPGI
jgi:hypothetical protein